MTLTQIRWKELPFTKDEVEEIGNIFKHTDIYTDLQVSENIIKSMSENGKLSEYKVIHFAVHGIFISEIPELSALVLSQLNEEKSEDGYLIADEVEKLEIQADFVNLSACQSGLGKFYRGEGIVGLTQAFLIAGANGLSVTLWLIYDKSTKLFMTELYKLVRDKKIGYAKAITEVKRKFITGYFGDKYRIPYYWAPFIYYGK